VSPAVVLDEITSCASRRAHTSSCARTCSRRLQDHKKLIEWRARGCEKYRVDDEVCAAVPGWSRRASTARVRAVTSARDELEQEGEIATRRPGVRGSRRDLMRTSRRRSRSRQAEDFRQSLIAKIGRGRGSPRQKPVLGQTSTDMQRKLRDGTSDKHKRRSRGHQPTSCLLLVGNESSLAARACARRDWWRPSSDKSSATRASPPRLVGAARVSGYRLSDADPRVTALRVSGMTQVARFAAARSEACMEKVGQEDPRAGEQAARERVAPRRRGKQHRPSGGY